MQKDFDKWNSRKKITHKEENPVLFYEREIWWVVLGANVGVEIDGKHELFLRPAVVIRKFNKHMAIVVPTTAQDKINKYYLKVSGSDTKTYTTCLSHLKTISSKRLFRKIGMITESDYQTLLKKVSDMVYGKL